ncbi:MAG: hypothetical protein ACYCSS_01570 [Sulfuriferula sp.]
MPPLSAARTSGKSNYSPEECATIQRANQTLRDRLVKAIRLADINDRVSANA